MKRRLPNLSYWLAGLYLVWSLVVFFGSLVGGSESHSWWPLFLYYIIWPLSALYEILSSTAGWIWPLNDYVVGFFYIVVGTLWVWWIGRIFSFVATRIFPIKEDEATALPSKQV